MKNAFSEQFQQVPTIQTDRLYLRPFTHGDMDQYLAFFRKPEVQQYLGKILIPRDKAEWDRWVNNLNGRCLKQKLVFTWCIVMKDSDRIVGRCDLGGFIRKSMADISYYIDSAVWRRGIASEAVKAVIDFGFNVLRLHRIQAWVLPENLGSVGLLRKIGFSEEGLLRQYDFGNEFHDTKVLSVLSEDWRR